MNEFFIRFRLQRSKAVLGDDQFDCWDMMSASSEEVSKFLSDCEAYQEQSAEKLRAEFGNQLNPLSGKHVLFCGDSITSDRLGYRAAVTKAAELDAYNVSFSGAVSLDLLLGIQDDIKKSAPDIISILIGANDSFCINKKENMNLCSPSEYRRNIRSILNFASNSGAAVLIMQIPMMDEKKYKDTNLTKYKTNSCENISIYNQIIDDEASRSGAALVRLSKLPSEHKDIDMFEPDGIHLTPDGHMLLAREWLKTAINL